MFKKFGVLALFITSLGAVTAPLAHAQGEYYGGYYGQRDRDWQKQQQRAYREQARAWRRAQEWRNRQWLANQWRAREWRARCDRGYYRGYQPGASFYLGYGR